MVRLLPLAIAGLLAARLPLLAHRRLDADELEHAHAAWCLFRGMLPYRDFFEHHTPWYYFLLRPFFRWFSVERSFDSALHFLWFARGLSLALTAISIWLLVAIGRLWEGRRVGLVAGLLLVSQPIFLHKTIEMRPDVPALALFLAALLCLLRGIREETPAGRQTASLFFAGGLCLGEAVMCTQKMLFVVPGALVGLGLWALPERRGRDRALVAEPRGPSRARWSAVALFGLGIALPGVLTWAVFAAQDAGGEFVANNFLLNARWKHVATNQLLKLVTTSWPVLALALLGCWLLLREMAGQRRRQPEGILLLSILAGLFLAIPAMPSPHRQYYLMPLPIVALFAARALLAVGGRVREAARRWFFGIALLTLSLLPALALLQTFQDRNDHQLARLRFVFDNSAPDDLVMDGWEGMGVFRPHAFHYYFLHEETLAMLPAPRLTAFLDELEAGRIRPRLIAMDQNLWRLGPRFTAFVNRHYRTADGFFYLARERYP